MGNHSSKVVQDLFLKALEISPNERDSWLAQQCNGDRELIDEVFSLLRHDSPSIDPLEKGLGINSTATPNSSQPQTQREEIKPGASDSSERTNHRFKQFGDYEIIEEIARGGMGIVYKAHQVSLNRNVALKMILAGDWADEEKIQRFQAEASAAAKMDHPGIVPIYEIGEHENQHYFAMAFVEGQSLAEQVKDGPLSPKEAAKIIAKIAAAIAYAHENGVIHRDLKPANVLMDSVGEARVTDFGLAKQIQSDSDLTQSGAVLGTPSYMSPEQAAGQTEQVGPQSDVYSLGAIFYFLLTGRPPFQASTIPDTLRQVLDEVPIPVRKLNPSSPRDLETICLKALSKTPERRYNDATAFAEDVSRWLSNRPIKARRVGRLERLRIWTKRRPMVAGLSIALFLIVLFGTFVLWERQNAAHAKGLVLALLKAETSETSGIISELGDYQYWSNNLLIDEWKSAEPGTNQKLHLAMALVSENESAREFLSQEILETHPSKFSLVCQSVAPYLNENQIEQIIKLAKANQNSSVRFRAACALAALAPQSKLWQDEEFTGFVASTLIQLPPSDFYQWTLVLNDVRQNLTKPLSDFYRDHQRDQQSRNFAADALGQFLSNDPDRLFALLIDSEQNVQLFNTVLKRLLPHRDKAIQLGNLIVNQEADPDTDDSELESLAKSKSNAAAMLLQMGEPENIWKCLKDHADPRLRHYLIHSLCRRVEDLDPIVAQYEKESDPGIKQSLMLCIGSFDLTENQRQPLVQRLLTAYRNEPDPGLHGALDWVLRKWNQSDAIDKVDQELQDADNLQTAEANHRKWFVNRQGQTFSILDAESFAMGSPISEKGRRYEEVRHVRQIARRFAISSKEVTVGQWKKFYADTKVWSPTNPKLHLPSDSSPMLAMSWYEAAHYCNWLSEQEGIPEEQHCYVRNSNDQYGPGMKAKDNFWELKGYRLPTEGEWEYACRAGTQTSRYFGESAELLPKYVWYRGNSNDKSSPVGRLKPNRFGLFDMQGNVYEWCYDQHQFLDENISPDKVLGDWPPTLSVAAKERRIVRGGAFNFAPSSLRSADRYYHYPADRTYNLGFRPARTIPE